MKQAEILSILEKLTQNLHDCITRLKKCKDHQIPAIEIGLLQNKLITLYDSTHQLIEFQKTTDIDLEDEVRQLSKQAAEVEDRIIRFEPSFENEETDDESNYEVSLGEVIGNSSDKNSSNKPEAAEPKTDKIHSRESKIEKEHQDSTILDKNTEIASSLDSQEYKEKEPIVDTDPEPETPEPETPEPEKPADVEKTPTKPAGKSLNERFGNSQNSDKLSLNERLAANKVKQQELSKKLSTTKPITDIAKAIPLNKQLLLMKQLFNGDKKSYKLTINFVNTCKTFSEARSFMQQEILKRHKKDAENPHYQDLLMLVKRKFML